MDPILNHILEDLKSKFRSTLVDRALERLDNVKQIREDIWEVEGKPQLGDKMLSYFVCFDKNTHRYSCDCFKSFHGASRERGMCSHIVSCIIYRKLRRTQNLSSQRVRNGVPGLKSRGGMEDLPWNLDNLDNGGENGR